MTPQQKILAKLLIGNKLLSEKQCAKVFSQVPEPEQALAKLVKAGHISDRIGNQLLEMYRAKSEQPAVEEKKPEPASDDDFAMAALEGDPVSSTESSAEITPDPKPVEKAPTGEKTPAKQPARAKGAAVPVDINPNARGKELAESFLRLGREMKASDVHLTSSLPPVVRVNTRLIELDLPPLSPEVCQEALLSLLDDERRAHFQKHRDLDFCYDGGPELGRFRANYLDEQNGMNGVFRLISPEVPSLDALGLPETVVKFTQYAVGIVLVTGPKSCGKTTTLASMVDLINRTRSEHVITIEDPIEFVHPCKKGHINQREVGSHTKSFGNALRAALREAPDVIMVGEMRDLETTSLAVTAAETGHLVLATLHTPDAIRTIGRVLDVFPSKEQGQIRAMLSESLRGVVSQELVPSPDGKDLHLALEVMVNTSAIGNLIREDRTFQLRGAMQTGRRLGMVLMDDSLVRLVSAGKISVEDAMSRAADKDYVMKELKSAGAKAKEMPKG